MFVTNDVENQTTKINQVNVINVKVSGEENAYTFLVTLHSDETGCEQYADWWEVINEKSELLYRRILVHSHPDTQPFTRGGGIVQIAKDEIVFVRGHFNKLGYVGDIMVGNVEKGFKKSTKIVNFLPKLENEEPLPNGCLF